MSSSQRCQSARKQGQLSSTSQAEASACTTLANISLARESHEDRVQSQGMGMHNLPPASEAIKLVYRKFPGGPAADSDLPMQVARVQLLFRALDLIYHN